MKKLTIMFVTGFFLLSGFVVSANYMLNNSEISDDPINIQTMKILFSFTNDGDYQIINEKDGQRIEVDGYGNLMVPGKPMLPSKKVMIALPPGAKVQSVNVKGIDATVVPGIYNIVPTPQIKPIDDPDQDIIERIREEYNENYENTYFSDQVYPSERGQLQGVGTLRKYSFVSVSLYPFSYHPQSGLLTCYEGAEIIIDYSTLSNDNSKSQKIEELNQDTLADEKASLLFMNYNEIKDYYQPSEPNPGPLTETHDYVIITTTDLSPAVTSSNFPDWKTLLGFDVKFVYITDDEITNQPGVDLAEQIRNFLREYYIQWGIEYVLLVGDYLTIPMRYCSPDLSWYVPTDVYYADLSYPDEDSWNSDGDGYYGEYGQDTPDFIAEVYVGRIPTSDLSRITYTLNKIVAFEQDTGAWKNNALQGGAILFFENEDYSGYDVVDGASCLDAIETDFMGSWGTSQYSEQEGLAPSEYEWPALNEPTFTLEWRTGQYSVVNWAAHGAPTSIGRLIWSWDDGDGVPEHDPGEITWGSFLSTSSNLEDDYPSIVFAVSCNVGRPEDGDNLGIKLLTNPLMGASVGIISATRGAAASLNWTQSHSGAEALCYEFNHYMINGPNGPERLGDAMYNSKAYVHYNFGWDHPYEYLNMYNYNVYGDPSLVREGVSDFPPETPVVAGPRIGVTGRYYSFTSSTTDVNGDQIYYNFSWGDGTYSGWIGPYDSGVSAQASHCWNDNGMCEIRVKAKDTQGCESSWSEPLIVRIFKVQVRSLEGPEVLPSMPSG